MHEIEKKITVHLYVGAWSRAKTNGLLDHATAQLHIAYDGKTYYCVGKGTSSKRREDHNHMIELFMNNKKMREKVPTAIVVAGFTHILSYYMYPHYAYMNHDIGSNWNLDVKKLKSKNIPISYQSLNSLLNQEVIFNDRKKEILVYKTTCQDAIYRNIFND